MPSIHVSYLLLVTFYACVTAIIVPDDFKVKAIPILETHLDSDKYCTQLFPGQDNIESCYAHYIRGSMSTGKFSCCDKRKADDVHKLGQIYVIGKFTMRCDETRYRILYKGNKIILLKTGPKKSYKLRCDLYSEITVGSLLRNWLGKQRKEVGVSERVALISLEDDADSDTSLWTNIVCVDTSSSSVIRHSKVD